MTDTRRKQIEDAARNNTDTRYHEHELLEACFIDGAEWADKTSETFAYSDLEHQRIEEQNAALIEERDRLNRALTCAFSVINQMLNGIEIEAEPKESEAK